jgi:hypothetical protein
MPVINNVAASEIAESGAAGRPIVTWRSADGRVVGPYFGGYGNLAAPPFVKGEREGRPLRVLLPSGISSAQLGQSSSNAIQTIERVLGPPAQLNVRTGGCGIDHETVWASPTAANLLTIFQHAGRFVGYQYGAPVQDIALIQAPGAALATRSGLTLNDTAARGRRLYGNGFTTSTASGGTWRATGDHGTLRGYLLPPNAALSVVRGNDPIANIAAGEIGCAPNSN